MLCLAFVLKDNSMLTFLLIIFVEKKMFIDTLFPSFWANQSDTEFYEERKGESSKYRKCKTTEESSDS